MRLEISIERDDSEKKLPMVLTNDEHDNRNFLLMEIDGKSYDISLDDLFHASMLFHNIRDLSEERDRKIDS